MKEIWKDVVGYEGIYNVSNIGEVKSLKFVKEKLLKPAVDNMGYFVVRLYKHKKSKVLKIHRLVALAFVPNLENKKTVNHINSIKKDNKEGNLEWCTQQENVQHAWATGLCKVKLGEKSFNAKLTEKDVLDIRKLSKFFKNKELAIIFDVDSSNISCINLRKTWKHI